MVRTFLSSLLAVTLIAGGSSAQSQSSDSDKRATKYTAKVQGRGLCACKAARCAVLLSFELPADISVAADPILRARTAEAMDYLAQRIGFRWHLTPRAEAMIYVHFVFGTEYMRARFNGEAHMPFSTKYDGVARVRICDAATIAHEICHILGFPHSPTGLMMAERSISLDDGITDQQIHYAALVRAAARR